MLSLRKNFGKTLEPAAGNGAFFSKIPHCVAVEIDPRHCLPEMINADFFDMPDSTKFDTIIGNPPYVRYQDIPDSTKNKFTADIFDKRSNLYLFFIEKCLRHLNKNGEIIFITPRDFLKATSSKKLNALLYNSGTITDIIDLGDQNIFGSHTPNCCIWRFEKDNLSHQTNDGREFICSEGQLFFISEKESCIFSDIFYVKVGAVSGCDELFDDMTHGDTDFIYSETIASGKTRRMIFNGKNDALLPHKERLINRKIKNFSENNWWEWGRLHYRSEHPRIYVNCKTRRQQPFFLHSCNNYDGSILAIFPRDSKADIQILCNLLNSVDWNELGFICDGRFIFSQRSLENALLPTIFAKYIPQKKI